MTPMSPTAVCAFPPPAPNAPRNVEHASYIHEILGYAGVGARTLRPEAIADALPSLRVLVTVGEGTLPDAIEAWVSEGGAWLAIGSTCGHASLLGVEVRPPTYALWGGALRSLGEGYLAPTSNDHPIVSNLPIPLHFFGGAAVEARDADVLATARDAHGRDTDAPAVTVRRVGTGVAVLIAPDLTGSVVRIQQGRAITRDGVSAPDGTAPTGDGVLKSDDGIVLDWILDRQEVPGAPGLRAFLQPVADLWREVVVRAILWCAEQTRTPVPILWYWPRALPAVGHLSHDTDGNDPERADDLLCALERADAPGTWCVILPGYDDSLLRRIEDAGHELATHYDAMSPGTTWSEREFDDQWRRLCARFGSAPVTNKNHYLRWQGDCEWLGWCVARGIRLDQSKGASKTGAAGFGFGACHPYRPVDPAGRTIGLLELPTPTQDLWVFAPEALAEPLIDAALRRHGVAHFLFHPAHMAKDQVADALVRTVERGRRDGMEWWTAAALVAWDDARRAAAWEDGTLHAGADLPGATTLIYAPWASGASVDGAPMPTATRWGLPFFQHVGDLACGARRTIEVTP